MKVTITITIADNTTEEQLAAAGLSQAKLCGLYTTAFSNLIKEIATTDVEWSLGVVTQDNTKEGSQ